MIGPLFYAANTMVFGSVASATFWELFRRPFATLALSYFGSHHLKARRINHLNMVKWADDPEVAVVFVPVSSFPKNKSVVNEDESG